MTITEFLIARLDEDEVAANARQGIFPSPSVEDSGAVWLHIKRSGNAVVVHYDHPVSGYGDMADLRTWADAEQGWTQDRALREIEAKRRIIAGHPVRPIRNGTCRTCSDQAGLSWASLEANDPDFVDWPCPTLRALASIWSDHPDYDPSWAPEKEGGEP